ncbi:MAG: N-acetyltransferase [Defluviimonas sp.]|uniref:GNAT family N-acetyltransferase n=1 Tax=Albidovulum sp. TaxID=1872424 RepID=UPI001D222A7D|nr:N-acetyltransferase [Paracoccaceae bacterium]MCC0064461.1 N-acetyltransferase [Defluviimonas sp.]
MSTEAVIRREDGPGGGRYVLDLGGVEAELTWKVLGPGRIVADHTLVPDALRGTGVGRQLVDRLVADARAEGVTIVPACSFVAAMARRHPAWADLFVSP